MRPAPSEQIERRDGVRKYLPDHKLSRFITIPTEKEGRDPKPPPFKLRTEGTLPNFVYTSPHGVISGDLLEQFPRHYQWKTASQLSYVRHHPTPPPYPGKGEVKFEPRADMVRLSWSGRRDSAGPYEYQKIVGGGGQLPEAKAWPLVQKQYAPFPHNTFGRADLFREVSVRPTVNYRGRQDEVRIYEPLERQPGRNPVNTASEYMAQYDRHIPGTEYRRPQFGTDRPMSKSVVLPYPYNHFNHMEHPHSLDYLPLPLNVSKCPTDVRLIT
ncbi:hypothetical protein ACOMHN_046921 [Nucella lapillus]